MRPPINEKQAKTKNSYLLRHFGITLAFYNDLRAHQAYCCAICGASEVGFKNGLAVDHNHKTGEIRGLLCWKCNRLLGKFRDNDTLLCAAAQYVVECPAKIFNRGVKLFTCPGRVGSADRAKALAKLAGKPNPKRRKSSGPRRSRKRAA